MDKALVHRAKILSPDLPWNAWDAETLGPVIMKFMEDHEPFYQRWAEVWFQNFQFIYGNQNLRWSKRYGYALDTDYLSRAPAVNQRAQTNISRVVQEALTAYLFASLPDWIVEAADASALRGKRFRKIIQKLLDAYMQRLCMDKELPVAAGIFTAFGSFAAEINWKKNAGRLMEIPKYKKVRAPVFTDYMAPNAVTMGLLEVPIQLKDSSGNPRFEERWEAVLDDMGQQIIDKVLAGDVGLDILTPFEFRREIGSPGPHKTKYCERIRLLDYDEYLDQYGGVEGQTKYFKQIQPVYSNAAVYKIAIRHFMRMQFTTPPQLGDLVGRNDSVFRGTLMRNKVLIVEHYDKPHPIKWPLGRRVVITNGQCTHITVPSYSTNKADGWHPFVEAQWLNVAPSSMATGPMNDVVAKNRELNTADSLIATAMRRNMGSMLLLKTGMGLEPQRVTGEPGMALEVQDPDGARWLHDDMPLPAVLPKLREMAKDDVYETSGAMDALRGDRTPGTSSGYMLRQIQEREEKRLAPARKRFEQAVAQMGEKIFVCLKQNVVKLDDDVMGYMERSAAGEFAPQDVIAMLTTPSDIGVEFNIGEGSMAIRSRATEMATLQEVAQNPGVSNRLSQDAEVLDNYLKEFEVESLRDGSADHRDRAERENEVFSDQLRLGPDLKGVQKPIVLFEDDDKIHIAKHTKFLIQNSEEWRQMMPAAGP